jgi:anhydro-N-acetylmuramic acid kinase
MSEERIFLGLYTGTAADGVDAAAVTVDGEGEVMSVTLKDHIEKYFPEGERRRILALAGGHIDSCTMLAELDRDVGIAAAATGRILMEKAELTSEDIEAIGWSGQTIAIDPPDSTNQLGGRLEVGTPAIIADRLGCPVVSHFAASDIAAGGSGGPLSAWCDWLLFRDRRFSRVIVNLGGSASLTFIPAAANIVDVVAYDVAPGTLVIDELIRRFHNRPFDVDGAIAGGGRVNPVLLNELLANAYFLEEPPKLLNPTDWSDTYHWRLLQLAEKHRVEGADLITTVTEMTARAIADGVANLTEIPHEVILTGGGSLNIHLAGRIRRLLCPSSTYTVEKYEFDIRSKQAVCTAILAAARMDGFSAHCPQTTGADKKTILGMVTMA